MEIVDFISNMGNSFYETVNQWRNNQRNYDAKNIYEAQHGSPFSKYLFPWIEKTVRPGNPVTGPPHKGYLGTNHPIAERGNKGPSSMAAPTSKPRKNKVIKPKFRSARQSSRRLRRRHRR
jgi:hypothetical protein